MTPEQVVGHVILTGLHNDLHIVGPVVLGDGKRTAVQVYLKNGYGVLLSTSLYGEFDFPFAVPIQKVTESGPGYRFAFGAHPDFSVIFSENDCTPYRVHQILSHLKSLR